MTGAGQYNLNILKKVEVTESFMGFDPEVIKCQNEETYDDCTTRQYLDHIKEVCGCLPLALRLSNEVGYVKYRLYNKSRLNLLNCIFRIQLVRQMKNSSVVRRGTT